METKEKKHPIEVILIIIFLVVFIIIPIFFMGGKDSSTSQTNTFYGYDCKGDCSGHRAGYNWAANKNITDSNDCGGNSNSFIEGCNAYVQGVDNRDNRW